MRHPKSPVIALRDSPPSTLYYLRTGAQSKVWEENIQVGAEPPIPFPMMTQPMGY